METRHCFIQQVSYVYIYSFEMLDGKMRLFDVSLNKPLTALWEISLLKTKPRLC